MIIDYNVQKTFTQSIDLVDAGNTCLRCVSEDACDYLVFIKTVAGKTCLLKVGPVVPDLPILTNGLDINVKKFEYNQKKIAKELDLYINDTKKKISNVEEITELEGFAEIPNLADAFMGGE